jgi:hypothetical protein
MLVKVVDLSMKTKAFENVKDQIGFCGSTSGFLQPAFFNSCHNITRATKAKADPIRVMLSQKES